MRQNLADRLAELPTLLSGHLTLTLVALAVALAVAIPLGVLSTRARWLERVGLGAASAIQTVPSLALLALMVPLLGGMIGAVPALIALTLYGVLPALRNTVSGIRNVDPAYVEAGVGLGMTRWQLMRQVELPLAAPVILAGVRVSAVWVAGIATLSTPVGAASLGNYIFMGLQTRNHIATLFGCVCAAVLAICLDQIVHTMQRAWERRSRRLAALGVSGVAALVVLAAWPHLAPDRDSGDVQMARFGGAVGAPGAASGPVIIGSKTFTEQYILAELLGSRLRSRGIEVEHRPGMGSTILFDALRNGSVDCYVDYTGTIWATIMKRQRPSGPVRTLIDVSAYLKSEHGILCVGALGFENTYALAMPRERAASLGISSIVDLPSQSAGWKLGGDYEFFGRPEWSALRDRYGLHHLQTVSMDSALMYEAVRGASVDVIAGFSTDGRLAAFDLVVLEDPRQAMPPYDAIMLLSPRASKRPEVVRALRPLVNAIRADTMRQANRLVDVDGQSVEAAARWLGGFHSGKLR